MVKRFDAAYTEAKRERNVLDFNDLEHLTLQVLTVEEEDGTGSFTGSRGVKADNTKKYW